MSKKQWIGEEFLIGTYQLGYRMVDLYALPQATGGRCDLCSGEKQSTIKVGMDYQYHDRPHAVLFHETIELLMMDMGVAFKPLSFEEDASDCRHFSFNHNQFTEIASRSSWFILKCEKDFLAAFKQVQKWRKNKKK